MKYLIFLLLVCSIMTSLAQTSKFKLTAKDTLITCSLTSRSTVSGPFSETHSADFEKLVEAVFKNSPFPAQPYLIYQMDGAGYVRLGTHTYDEIEYHTFFLYNLDSVSGFNVKAQTKYGPIAIISHEVGHHALNHFVKSSRQPVDLQELQADYFAGWTMAKLKVPKTEVTKGIAAVTRDGQTSSEYPATKDRISATMLGYNVGMQTEGGPLSLLASGKLPAYNWLKKWSRVVSAPVSAVPLREGVFDADQKIVLDNAGQLIYQIKGKNFVIARAIPSKDQTYKYIIFDNDFNCWLLERDGTIRDTNRTKVIGRVNMSVLE